MENKPWRNSWIFLNFPESLENKYIHFTGEILDIPHKTQENKDDTNFAGSHSELTPAQYSPNQSDSGGQFLQQKNIQILRFLGPWWAPDHPK